MSREYTPVFTRTTRLYKRDTYKKTHTYDPGPHLVSTPVIQMYFTPVHTRAHLYSCVLYTYKRPKKKKRENETHTTTHTYYVEACLVSTHRMHTLICMYFTSI